MIIILNGKETEFQGGSVRRLLEQYRLNPEAVAVERNGEIIHRDTYRGTNLEDGDRLEVVTFVGGG